jgi:4-hydroxyacetophenone monooxygenase
MALADLTPFLVDPENARRMLDGADAATLLMSLVQLTGDASLLHEARTHIAGPMAYHETMPEPLRRKIRDALFDVLRHLARQEDDAPPTPSDALLHMMMETAAGGPVAEDYADMVREEIAADAVDPGELRWSRPPSPDALADYPVAIIGAGMSGLYAAMRLKAAGLPFVVFEKNETVGGTWFENRYPGCGVDTPNHFYSYASEPSCDWSRFFAKRDELWRYFEDVADRRALRAHIRFRTEVESLTWDEVAGLWRLMVRDAAGGISVHSARVVISAVGILNRPAIPDVPGLETFAGQAFHTAQWDPEWKPEGRRVVMVGTGASGHQVGPVIAPKVESLTILQRSPHWVVPNPAYFEEVSEGKKWCLAHVPHYLRWYRFQLFWAFADGIYDALRIDPDWPEPGLAINAANNRHRTELGEREDLIAKVIPNYPPYGKRILIDNLWFRMLKRDNVSLVASGIGRIEPDAVIDADGVRHPCDTLIWATGFKASRMLAPMRIIGRGGQDLRSLWGEDDARAHLGVTVPGFPNFFMLTGPNTGLAHGGNAIFMTECQMRYVLDGIRTLVETGGRDLDVSVGAYEAYNAEVDERHAGLVWSHKGMTNWYRNSAGRVFALSPWRLVDYWRMTRSFDVENYGFTTLAEAAASRRRVGA